MVRIKDAKLTRVGNSFGFLIPKALIDCEILIKGENYILQIVKKAFCELCTRFLGCYA